MIKITVILIEPENAGNAGAICRAMKNFDFEELILVGPTFKTDSVDLRKRAKWANDLVDKIEIIPKYNPKVLQKLRKDFDYLIATTAKLGRDYNILRSPITPEQLAIRLSELEFKKDNRILKDKKIKKGAKKNINIGMATALPDGNLIVPVIKNANEKNLTGLAKAVNDLAERARSNKLKPDEITGGTFTITNFGSYNNLAGTPIINQPQAAILGTGVVRKTPAVIETPDGDMIAIRQIMILSMSYDHRVIDGALAGRFLHRVKEILENYSPELP